MLPSELKVGVCGLGEPALAFCLTKGDVSRRVATDAGTKLPRLVGAAVLPCLGESQLKAVETGFSLKNSADLFLARPDAWGTPR